MNGRAFVMLLGAGALISGSSAPAFAQVAVPVPTISVTVPPLTLPPVTLPALGPAPTVDVPTLPLGGQPTPTPSSMPATAPSSVPSSTTSPTRAGAGSIPGSTAAPVAAAVSPSIDERSVPAAPADVHGAVNRSKQSGLWSTIGSVAAGFGPWIALLAIAIAAQLAVSSAWRDRLRRFRRVSSD